MTIFAKLYLNEDVDTLVALLLTARGLDVITLKSHLETAIAKVYPSSRKLAIKEEKRAKLGVRVSLEKEYPLDCPFTIGQILDEDFEGLD